MKKHLDKHIGISDSNTSIIRQKLTGNLYLDMLEYTIHPLVTEINEYFMYSTRWSSTTLLQTS